MIVKLLTEHHLEFLSLKGGCRSLSESTLVNCQIVENLMPQLIFYFFLFYKSICLVFCEKLYGPRCEENCLRGFTTHRVSNQSPQLQRLARKL